MVIQVIETGAATCKCHGVLSRSGQLRALAPMKNGSVHQEAGVEVALVNERSLSRAGLCSILNADRHLSVVDEVASVDLLLETCSVPDVIVLDSELPGLDVPCDAARLGAPVVLMGSGEDSGRAWSALSSGVRGFVDREQSPHGIRTAVHAVGLGGASFPPQMVGRLLDAALAHEGADVTAQGVLIRMLTRRERQVFRQMAQGLDNGEIAALLVIGMSTVKSHINSILRKLDVTNRTQAVLFGSRTQASLSSPLTAPFDDVVWQLKESAARAPRTPV